MVVLLSIGQKEKEVLKKMVETKAAAATEEVIWILIANGLD